MRLWRAGASTASFPSDLLAGAVGGRSLQTLTAVASPLPCAHGAFSRAAVCAAEAQQRLGGCPDLAPLLASVSATATPTSAVSASATRIAVLVQLDTRELGLQGT